MWPMFLEASREAARHSEPRQTGTTIIHTSSAQGEIVWIDFDPQSGHEQAGRRPALVISKMTYNQRIGHAFVCPIASKVKGYLFEVPIQTKSVKGVVPSDHFKN
jgi:mRNA interferase MazF